MVAHFKRFGLRRTALGWEVFDIWTGCAIRQRGVLQIGLTEEQARAVAEWENTRARNGVRSVPL